ncbi:ATP/GTPase [Candidatus Magnetobacterium bavaricum]|uniref:ATP/GTPase n=1 Tax=Candidatus Magnetobacterium bavaricum TaxID=29290 RepID=A0A0F3GMP9_9BACT|nr:ATP/GTPase [Candidatus Magnetobacterium bavaricum]
MLKRRIHMAYIQDEQRINIANAINNNITRGKSVLLIGEYGVGKSFFIKNMFKDNVKAVWAESLYSYKFFLTDILSKSVINISPKIKSRDHFFKTILRLKDIFIIIDEAAYLEKKLLPFIKRIMDIPIPVIMIGLPTFEQTLVNNYPDILSRLKTLRMQRLDVDDVAKTTPHIDKDALEMIYGHAMGNMRKFIEVYYDCYDKMKSLKLERINADIAYQFIEGGNI